MTKDKAIGITELPQYTQATIGEWVEAGVTLRGELGKSERQVRELQHHITKLRDALLWCGGSPDFNPGGQARQGWIIEVAPLLQPIQAEAGQEA